jgi:hypothetical protein
MKIENYIIFCYQLQRNYHPLFSSTTPPELNGANKISRISNGFYPEEPWSLDIWRRSSARIRPDAGAGGLAQGFNP